MKFELKDEYLHWGEVKMGSTLCELALPSGVIKVAIVIGGKKAVVSGFGRKCSVFNEPKIPTLLFSGAGFLPKGICGDAIITIHEMGYDLTSKDDIKKAIKQDREKIVAEYEKLVSEKPELFDEKRIKDTQLNSKKTVTKTKPSKKVNKQKTKRKSPSTKKLDEKLKTKEPSNSFDESQTNEPKEQKDSNVKKTPDIEEKIINTIIKSVEKTTIKRMGKVRKLFEGSDDQKETTKKINKIRRECNNGKISLTKYKKMIKELTDEEGWGVNFRLAKSTHELFITDKSLKNQLKSEGIKSFDERNFIRRDRKMKKKTTKNKKNDTITIKDGKFDGLYLTWFENGQKKEEGNYNNGEQVGKWTYWFDSGKKEKEETYKNGKKISEYFFVCDDIIELLKEQGTKITSTDIDAHLKYKNVDEVKKICEKMYHDGEISRTSNYRYFVLTKKKPKSTQSKQVDIGKELKKYKDLLDQELITQEDYDAKKKELLGL